MVRGSSACWSVGVTILHVLHHSSSFTAQIHACMTAAIVGTFCAYLPRTLEVYYTSSLKAPCSTSCCARHLARCCAPGRTWSLANTWRSCGSTSRRTSSNTSGLTSSCSTTCACGGDRSCGEDSCCHRLHGSSTKLQAKRLARPAAERRLGAGRCPAAERQQPRSPGMPPLRPSPQAATQPAALPVPAAAWL